MTPERWQQVKEIVQSAIERPPSERDGFISQACADDPDLRSHVQSLISSHDEAGDSFQSVAVNLAAQMIFDDGAKSLLGHCIGPYEITALIAESFMKTLKYEEVYRSEYRDLTDARNQTRRFIEDVYNQKRLHSALGYRSSVEFEKKVLLEAQLSEAQT